MAGKGGEGVVSVTRNPVRGFPLIIRCAVINKYGCLNVQRRVQVVRYPLPKCRLFFIRFEKTNTKLIIKTLNQSTKLNKNKYLVFSIVVVGGRTNGQNHKCNDWKWYERGPPIMRCLLSIITRVKLFFIKQRFQYQLNKILIDLSVGRINDDGFIFGHFPFVLL